MWRNLPVDRPKPNGQRFVDIIMGRAPAVRVPLVEYIVDDVLLQPIVDHLLGRRWVPWTADADGQRRYLDNFISVWQDLGYDCVRYETSLDFAKPVLLAPDPAPASRGDRAWADEHQGAITSWSEFEAYAWPSATTADYSAFEYICANLPDGMGFLTCHAGGVFETVSQLMSLEGLCFALHDSPELVRAVTDRVGELMVAFYDHLLSLDGVVAVFQGDDMGFRSGTLISPRDLRTYFLPWQKRLADRAHKAGLPFFLHSCGNLGPIYDDLVRRVGMDAKHSFEDAIMPAEEFQVVYGDRIGVLGGVDVNILAGGSTAAVRTRTRQLIEDCGGRGRFAVGSGNSIPSYVPVENYLSMVDEALDQ